MGEELKVVPLVPTEVQWNGLARSIMMAFDMDAKTPRKLLKHLEHSGVDAPQWLLDEAEMQHKDHTISKGTRCVLIYRAMVEDAPAQPPARVEVSEAAAALVRKLQLIHENPEFKSIWFHLANHGIPYKGPQYADELAALTAALGLGGV